MLSNKPTITVAIPSYNKERYIDKCIQSILAENDKIAEIILVDNCSTDNTFEVAKRYEPKIKCVKNETNLGMSGNWNKCIDLCKTDWLMIFHADDEMLPGAIDKYVELINQYPSLGLVHADSYSRVEGRSDFEEYIPSKNKNFWSAGADALKCPYGACSAVIVKMDAYKKQGYFIDKSLSSDAEMWARIASRFDVGYINSPTVIYFINQSSTGLNSLVNRSLKEIRADWDMLTEKIAEYQPNEESRRAYLKDNFKRLPYGYWAVFKAKLKSGDYWSAFKTLLFIIFACRGLLLILGIVGINIKRVFKRFSYKK